jgi:hypothetical protein
MFGLSTQPASLHMRTAATPRRLLAGALLLGVVCAATSTPRTSFAASALTRPNATITARFVGLPILLWAGGPPVEFTAALTNHSTTAAKDIAPVFQVVAGPINYVAGSLQRFDPRTATWHTVRMPEGDGYDPLTAASDGVDIAPGATARFHFRLRISFSNPNEPATSILYAVALPSFRQAGITTEKTTIKRTVSL